ncbi:hypothetical protein GCD22_02725 [Acidithiobacillus thiooxidans ATCC 19377]|uniref:Uncharacterized protein n=1 Tax=Acidithiobacillus thiooxidans ATCC 19377 TaxID=637390 RepID=A0A5P9XS76_ACITH|nr:hypothetical protein GCD22_02725 [Acidithiobacillus thiooxidans ATCC 19377]
MTKTSSIPGDTLSYIFGYDQFAIAWNEKTGVCQGSCRVTHFLSDLFILPLHFDCSDLTLADP